LQPKVFVDRAKEIEVLLEDGMNGFPWITRHSVRRPRLFMSNVSEEIVSATPPL